MSKETENLNNQMSVEEAAAAIQKIIVNTAPEWHLKAEDWLRIYYHQHPLKYIRYKFYKLLHK